MSPWTTPIDATVARREAEIARRKRPITGLTEFPHLAETLPERTPPGETARPVRRYGATFEALRDEPAHRRTSSSPRWARSPRTPRGRPSPANLFAAGGIAVDVAGPTKGAADLVAAYDGQPVVCLAGTDAAYAEWGGRGRDGAPRGRRHAG